MNLTSIIIKMNMNAAKIKSNVVKTRQQLYLKEQYHRLRMSR